MNLVITMENNLIDFSPKIILLNFVKIMIFLAALGISCGLIRAFADKPYQLARFSKCWNKEL